MIFDYIKIKPKLNTENECDPFIDAAIELNGVDIKCYANIISFFVYFDLSVHKNDIDYERTEPTAVSDFYPFGCSCGSPGCNGIYNGIFVKNRKKTIEWRITPDDHKSYSNILPLNFYSFNKHQYRYEVLKCWEWIVENTNIVEKEKHHQNEILNVHDFIKHYHPDSFERLESSMKDLASYREIIKKTKFIQKYSKKIGKSNAQL